MSTPAKKPSAETLEALVPSTPYMYSPTLGYITDPESLAAFEEAEEIIARIRAGEYSGPSYNCFAELLAEIDEEIKAEASAV